MGEAATTLDRHRTFGGYLRGFRQAARLTQEELAFKAGLSPRTVQQLEGDRVRRPRRDSVRLLVGALDLTGDDQARLEAASRSAAPRHEAGRPPAQLPPSIVDFVGRHAETSTATQWMTSYPRPCGLPIVSLLGAAGAGKTALAVHIGHLLRPSFPDGQLYADLGGLHRPADPAMVLGRFLRALDVHPSSLPSDVDELAQTFRSVTADRRILVVLDDVSDADQVRPLLPGTASCAALLTSRHVLNGIDAARCVALGVLAGAEADSLFEQIVGRDRVRADPVATRSIVRRCAGLPLAVRAAGACLASRRMSSFAAQLEDDVNVLDLLGGGECGLRARLGASYRALSPVGQDAFRRLGSVPRDGFSASEVSVAQSALDELTGLRLLDLVDADTARYRVHELVALYALDQYQ